MGVFEQFPLLTFFLVAVAVLLIISTIKSRRSGTEPKEPAGCRQCGASLPRHAKFCSRCGQKL